MVAIVHGSTMYPVKNEVCQNVLINEDVWYVLNTVKNKSSRKNKVVELYAIALVV